MNLERAEIYGLIRTVVINLLDFELEKRATGHQTDEADNMIGHCVYVQGYMGCKQVRLLSANSCFYPLLIAN